MKTKWIGLLGFVPFVGLVSGIGYLEAYKLGIPAWVGIGSSLAVMIGILLISASMVWGMSKLI